MSKAKYYIYRNLHKNTFSVKYKGKVIAHHDYIIADNVEFRVSEKIRQKVLTEKKKYVHAYVVCEKYTPITPIWDAICNENMFTEVSYNPYKQSTFTALGHPIRTAHNCMLGRNKVWIGDTVAA